MQISKSTLILLLISILLISCGDDILPEKEMEMAEPNSYPKVFGNAEIIKSQADMYSQLFGELTYEYTIYFEADTSYTITLLDSTTLTESYFGDETQYEIIDSCIVDFRTFRQLTINEEGTSITFETLLVGSTDYAWLPIDFDCAKTQDEIIEDAIRFLANAGSPIDTIRLERFVQRVELIP